MQNRVPNPKAALDYPTLDDDLWVVWTNHGIDAVWPSGKRSIYYMSKTRTDAMRGWSLLTSDYTDALTFETMAEAADHVAEHAIKRGQPYHRIEITKVAEIKHRIFGVSV